MEFRASVSVATVIETFLFNEVLLFTLLFFFINIVIHSV